MPGLTPADYETLGMPDLVNMTWERIGEIERRHYRVLLRTLERGHTTADDRRLADLEQRRAVHLGRLMPADAHDEDPGQRTEGQAPPAGDAADDDAAGGAPDLPPPPADGPVEHVGERAVEQGHGETPAEETPAT